ncbi:amidohydrolase family protein [Reichenbachiella versicolor]|uniref:amidohydrolase family protein n=1 Tax=Reichenbachiella versicolor TaxID=1821036 RepID=UPI000D6E85A3|nr:amidohydrolase family protein [Reichenbachiella versicolor]
MRLDSHNHFWNYNPEKHSWINDEMSVIRQDFGPADLKSLLAQTGLEGTVAVQADQTEAETEFLLDLAQSNDFIKAVVGWVDLRSENLNERLSHFAQYEKLVGVRHVVQDEPDPNFMLGEDFQRGLSLLKDYGLTYDILIFPSQLDAAIETVRRHPKQKFVVDHIAKPYIKDGKLDGWKEKIQLLSSFDNVMCKISGMVTEADWNNWSQKDFTPYMDVIVEAFGKNRIMYGSDWPVCLLGGEYSEIKGIVDQYFSSYAEEDQNKIFGLNAAEFYGIK